MITCVRDILPEKFWGPGKGAVAASVQSHDDGALEDFLEGLEANLVFREDFITKRFGK